MKFLDAGARKATHPIALESEAIETNLQPSTAKEDPQRAEPNKESESLRREKPLNDEEDHRSSLEKVNTREAPNCDKSKSDSGDPKQDQILLLMILPNQRPSSLKIAPPVQIKATPQRDNDAPKRVLREKVEPIYRQGLSKTCPILQCERRPRGTTIETPKGRR